MKLLILGGTRFVGRHLVEAALAGGHEVTLFHRGRTGVELFPEVERLHGDRDKELSVLAGRRWDAVIDTCGYVPRAVKASAELLANAVNLYAFISSISVYAEVAKPGLKEEDAPGALEDETVEEVTGETYGPLKALCERAAEEAMPGRVLVVRPGLIVGPHDPTDRFTHWPWRVSLGGEVLAPGERETSVQFIDARDLASWTLRMIERGETGIYNATGPAEPLSMERFLAACKAVTGSQGEFTWVSEAFLKAEGVKAFSELPLWLPEEARGLRGVDCRKALGEGLLFKPLEVTIRDTLVWGRSRPADLQRRAGLSLEKEKELLERWRAHPKGRRQTGRDR
jgi:2'-hydroxyisoflavone reductase